MKLFLFGEAHDEHYQLAQGSLLAAWGGKVGPARTICCSQLGWQTIVPPGPHCQLVQA